MVFPERRWKRPFPVARASCPCVPGPSWPWKQRPCTAKMAVRRMGSGAHATSFNGLSGPGPAEVHHLRQGQPVLVRRLQGLVQTQRHQAAVWGRRPEREHRLCFMVHLIGSVRLEWGLPCSFCECAL